MATIASWRISPRRLTLMAMALSLGGVALGSGAGITTASATPVVKGGQAQTGIWIVGTSEDSFSDRVLDAIKNDEAVTEDAALVIKSLRKSASRGTNLKLPGSPGGMASDRAELESLSLRLRDSTKEAGASRPTFDDSDDSVNKAHRGGPDAIPGVSSKEDIALTTGSLGRCPRRLKVAGVPKSAPSPTRSAFAGS